MFPFLLFSLPSRSVKIPVRIPRRAGDRSLSSSCPDEAGIRVGSHSRRRQPIRAELVRVISPARPPSRNPAVQWKRRRADTSLPVIAETHRLGPDARRSSADVLALRVSPRQSRRTSPPASSYRHLRRNGRTPHTNRQSGEWKPALSRHPARGIPYVHGIVIPETITRTTTPLNQSFERIPGRGIVPEAVSALNSERAVTTSVNGAYTSQSMPNGMSN